VLWVLRYYRKPPRLLQFLIYQSLLFHQFSFTRHLRASPVVSMASSAAPRAQPPSPCSAGAASPSPRSSASRCYRCLAGRAFVSLRASTGVRGSVHASSAGASPRRRICRRPGARASSSRGFSPVAHLPDVPARRHAPLLYATGRVASASRGSSFNRALPVRAGARARTASSRRNQGLWPARVPPAPDLRLWPCPCVLQSPASPASPASSVSLTCSPRPPLQPPVLRRASSIYVDSAYYKVVNMYLKKELSHFCYIAVRGHSANLVKVQIRGSLAHYLYIAADR
jgi:hypothetical protein